MFDLRQYAEDALQIAGPSIESAIKRCPGRNAVYVVILDPRQPYTQGAKLPVLSERWFGEESPGKWLRDCKVITYSKAEVCWRTGMSTRTVGEKAPYLYEEGDTKFPGGVVCDGLIVAASGLDWQFDEACAHMVIAFLWAKVRRERDLVMADQSCIFF